MSRPDRSDVLTSARVARQIWRSARERHDRLRMSLDNVEAEICSLRDTLAERERQATSLIWLVQGLDEEARAAARICRLLGLPIEGEDVPPREDDEEPVERPEPAPVPEPAQEPPQVAQEPPQEPPQVPPQVAQEATVRRLSLLERIEDVLVASGRPMRAAHVHVALGGDVFLDDVHRYLARLHRCGRVHRVTKGLYVAKREPSPAVPEARLRRGANRGPTLPDAGLYDQIERCVHEAGVPVKAGQVRDKLGLPLDRLPALHTGLSVLAREGRLRRVGRGLYESADGTTPLEASEKKPPFAERLLRLIREKGKVRRSEIWRHLGEKESRSRLDKAIVKLKDRKQIRQVVPGLYAYVGEK